LAKGLIRDDFITMPTPSMTCAFGAHEKTKKGFARMLGEIAALGQVLARPSREPVGELIHDGRVLIKRARALLWFARPALSPAAHTRARARLRKAAGFMAEQRDFMVTQATLEDLASKAAPDSRDRAALEEIIQHLLRLSPEEPEKKLRQSLRKAMGILHKSANDLKRSAARGDGWPSPCNRVEKALRGLRRAGKRARMTDSDIDFHEWRKKAKRLFYLLELAEAGLGRRMARARKRVEKLQDTLGAYHDGVVVEDRLLRMVPLSIAARRVLRLLKRRKARLRKKACKIAQGV
jgi:CHAD domain-containing protein